MTTIAIATIVKRIDASDRLAVYRSCCPGSHRRSPARQVISSGRRAMSPWRVSRGSLQMTVYQRALEQR